MSATYGISPEVLKAHRAAWYVYAGGQRIRHSRTMRGLWGYDVVCSCGWDSKTGGATRGYVTEQLWGHRWEAQDAHEDLTASGAGSDHGKEDGDAIPDQGSRQLAPAGRGQGGQLGPQVGSPARQGRCGGRDRGRGQGAACGTQGSRAAEAGVTRMDGVDDNRLTMTAETGCTERCWTAVRCPVCDQELPPRGRSMPPEMGIMDCCDQARMDSRFNPRHLWTAEEARNG